VPWRWVHVRRPWWGTPTVVGGGAVESHSGVAVLAATTAVAAVVVPIPVVVAAGAAAVVLAKRVRWRQGRWQWSGWRFVRVERPRSILTSVDHWNTTQYSAAILSNKHFKYCR
jgi:hypothetical protein